jgi:dTMP kinase
MKGKLIAFEGIDGSGAETQANRLLRHLRDTGITAEKFDYPDYSSPVGKLIKEYLYSSGEFSLSMQFLLHLADKAKDVPLIRQHLESGKTVICNRYFNSILGYQCGQGFPLGKALEMAGIFGIPKPDVVFYLRISPGTSLERKKREKDGKNRQEREGQCPQGKGF